MSICFLAKDYKVSRKMYRFLDKICNFLAIATKKVDNISRREIPVTRNGSVTLPFLGNVGQSERLEGSRSAQDIGSKLRRNWKVAGSNLCASNSFTHETSVKYNSSPVAFLFAFKCMRAVTEVHKCVKVSGIAGRNT